MKKPTPHTTEIMFIRKYNLIKDIHGTVVFIGTYTDRGNTYPSINAAKRESRRLQEIHGQGCVRTH